MIKYFFTQEPHLNDKRGTIKQIIKDLHAGTTGRDLRKRFAALIKDSSKKAGEPSNAPGHPVYIFIEENREAKRQLKDLKRVLEGGRDGVNH